jgi:glycosyltransferase involved in cell wall biosynthesis
VVAVSEFTRQIAIQHYPVDVAVIPNGVDLQKLAPKSIQPGKPPLIVFAGRFMPQKNPLQFVKTLAEIRRLEWRCAMVGNGPLFDQTIQAAQAAGLHERIIFPGWVTPEEVADWFDQADILFMPSLTEGLPVVGVKAVAKGLAIVASRIGGFLDIVNHGENGYLIDLHQPENYADALTSLLTDPQHLLSFRQASLQKSQHFDIEKVARAYQAIFLKVKERHG